MNDGSRQQPCSSSRSGICCAVWTADCWLFKLLGCDKSSIAGGCGVTVHVLQRSAADRWRISNTVQLKYDCRNHKLLCLSAPGSLHCASSPGSMACATESTTTTGFNRRGTSQASGLADHCRLQTSPNTRRISCCDDGRRARCASPKLNNCSTVQLNLQMLFCVLSKACPADKTHRFG